MKFLVRILLCCAALSVIACGGDNSFMAQLRHLDSLLIEHPDSVYQVLGGMEKEAHAQSESSRMYYDLLRADAQNKAYIDFTTDSVMLQVAEYYDQHGTANEQMRAHYLLGCTYRDLNDAPMELQSFQEATEKADTTQKDCDLYTLYAIYGQMADIYHSQFLPEEELKTYQACERIALLDKDENSAVDAYCLQIKAYHLMNMQDSVLSISARAQKRYLQHGDTISAARILCPAINAYIEKEQYDSAKAYLRTFEEFSGNIENGKIINADFAIFNYYKGLVLLHENNVDSALVCFHDLTRFGEKEAAYKGLLSVYKKIDNADSITKYAYLFAEANDSSFLGSNHERISQITSMYKYGRAKSTADKAKAQLIAEKDKSFLFTILIFVLITIAVMLSYGITKNRRSTINKIKELNQEIEHKTSLLLELEASQKNDDEELLLIKESLHKAQQELAKYREADTLTAFYESEIYLLFHKNSKGPCKITNAEWETLTVLFNSTFSSYTDFIHSGKSMTNDQIKVCMLIRMGFAESEMANILNVDNRRVTRIKIQLNQKLFNMDNAKELAINLKAHF